MLTSFALSLLLLSPQDADPQRCRALAEVWGPVASADLSSNIRISASMPEELQADYARDRAQLETLIRSLDVVGRGFRSAPEPTAGVQRSILDLDRAQAQALADRCEAALAAERR